MTAPDDIVRERGDEWWEPIPRRKPLLLEYPPEVEAQAAANAQRRADQEARDSLPCGTCGQRRDHLDHQYIPGRLGIRCEFVPTCPNADDPVLCKYDPTIGKFVPEASCPVHDPDRSTE